MRKRVVVTGLGAVTPVGNDESSYWDSLIAGRSGVATITRFDASELGVYIAGEVKDFDPVSLFGRREARRNDLFTLFALEATQQAIRDADLDLNQTNGLDVGVLIGTGIGGIMSLLENYQVMQQYGSHRVSPFMIPMMMPNAASAVVAIEFGLRGPNFSLSSACATGTHAIAEAIEIIRRGHVMVMICGGSEAATTPLSLAAFKNMGALSTRSGDPCRVSRPFDANRDGFVIGEGAGIMVIERLEHALKRHARIYCEIIGQGASSDAFHITAPDERGFGAALSMQRALEDACIAPQEVDYINAHGTSTPLNDRVETRAIHMVFGSHADRLAVSSTKSMIGHLMGAAGAVEAIACVKSLETGWLHPTINYETPDPECDLDYVPNEARKSDPQIALSNSFGFGGHNGSLVFRRWKAG